MNKTAAALIIGNELLTGKTQESNLLGLARTLRSLGIVLSRTVLVLDDKSTIAKEVSELASSHDYLFTSGGVGPTHDDVTQDGIAAAFGVPIVIDPTLEKMVRDYYKGDVNEGKLRLARVPEGARLVYATSSPWPVTVLNNVWIIPGIPEIFRMKLPIIQEHLGTGTPFVSRSVFVKMEEHDLKSILDDLVQGHPAVEVGSYPAWNNPNYHTKVTFDGKEQEAIDRAVQEFLGRLPENEPQWME